MTTKTPTTRHRRAKLRPEFDFAPLVIQLVQAYLGPRTVAKLTTTQATQIQQLAGHLAGQLGLVLTEPDYTLSVGTTPLRDRQIKALDNDGFLTTTELASLAKQAGVG